MAETEVTPGCVGDLDARHAPECDRVATEEVMQEDCPPGCTHQVSKECLAVIVSSEPGVYYFTRALGSRNAFSLIEGGV